MSEASVKIADMQRELGDAVTAKNRLQQQHVDLLHRADETTNQLDQAIKAKTCLLYTSDAADDLLCVDLGGRRIIKKKKK